MRPLQAEIKKVLAVKETIDPQKEIDMRVSFLKEYLKQHPFLKTYVLGISGGQDSTLAGKLAQIAIAELREEMGDDSYRFIAVRLPHGVQADESDAQAALSFIQPDESYAINIEPAVSAMVATFAEQNLPIGDFNKGNIKARQRMIVQYAIAGERQGAVIGTDHAAESVTGFYTKFGDGASDIFPLAGLNKRQGRSLLKTLAAPESLYLKVPTADLEENKPMLPDEVALGVTYDEIDDYLEGKSVSEAAAEQIERHYLKSEHKRHLPITPFDTFWKKELKS
ncbi:ammonia-dependent NAD(+) synthetase [Vagococcus lutrae]|uniref:ammonia-dependent NAD(+) synthetase n=1 Tax=Vagococcus lutrae TaxID=81947 RepID=UPI00232FC169|nr:ammonia-dependent NAD(+) synthetase [Vagococcus lutrae]MDO5741743.1 ammonia-dependent NAD(+) synthetase [Vagococcus sp.]MDT2811466.1 ammonia-dependent NAD(+) synthetase [Vagococcus lutrae]MDT2819054.1 ammonia-dependent NAD(+) synthetase [Vagococcus lutrae]MDT2843989.1 ammonia-dependent NAD(+) synthetase [Vagococcus lutrae]WCG04855.1 ammonia-dependent NAD(+) synthetase [Vagococcus lutrae]